jgi:hypothetical protein
MNSIHFLRAALFATALIHVSYIGILLRRHQRLQRLMKEPEKNAGR